MLMRVVNDEWCWWLADEETVHAGPVDTTPMLGPKRVSLSFEVGWSVVGVVVVVTAPAPAPIG